MKDNNSKIVKVFRVIPFSQEANIELEDLFSGASRGLGSYFSRGSKKAGSGLSFEEVDLLMPIVINRPASHNDFAKEVDIFFIDITTKIPQEGLPLETGLSKSNDEPLSKDNMPINVEQYIMYRHAISHPHCAMSKEEAYGNQLITAYILDDKKTAASAKVDNDIRDIAATRYLSIKDDTNKVDMVLTNIGIDTREMDELKKVLKLKEYISSSDISHSKLFIKIEKDEKLDSKYRIQKLIQSGVLKRVGNVIIITEDGSKIGTGIEEAVVFWEDESNSDIVGVLKARFQEFRKKKTSLSSKLKAKAKVEEEEDNNEDNENDELDN